MAFDRRGNGVLSRWWERRAEGDQSGIWRVSGYKTKADAFAAGEQKFQAFGCAAYHVPRTFLDGQIHDVGMGGPGAEEEFPRAREPCSIRRVCAASGSPRHTFTTAMQRHFKRCCNPGQRTTWGGNWGNDEIDDLIAYLLALLVGN